MPSYPKTKVGEEASDHGASLLSNYLRKASGCGGCEVLADSDQLVSDVPILLADRQFLRT